MPHSAVAVGHWLLDFVFIGLWLLAIGFWILAIGFWPLACGPIAIGHWPLAVLFGSKREEGPSGSKRNGPSGSKREEPLSVSKRGVPSGSKRALRFKEG